MSNHNRERHLLTTDVVLIQFDAEWRQLMVTYYPFVMTYRPQVVLLIDLGTLLSLKLLICCSVKNTRMKKEENKLIPQNKEIRRSRKY